MTTRYKGRVREWKGDRGFGFILPSEGGPDVFLHVSALEDRRNVPDVGDLVTYELARDERGRPQARAVRPSGQPAPERLPTSVRGPSATHSRGDREQSSGKGGIAAALVVVALGAWGWSKYKAHQEVLAYEAELESERETLVSAPARSERNSRPADCDSRKNSCSRMTSCAEATYYQEKCGVGNMDGDGDGVPCESQWCGH